ncbi:TetR/AcrR family transcriptional regulator [Streptomyces sp. NPDC089919]|uniref:TetR/AcrR family transcriptional regulator n=1 Tax=Streptomyces sp. NPDC089919 TaxID=3155188 RepID=UPI003423AF3D
MERTRTTAGRAPASGVAAPKTPGRAPATDAEVRTLLLDAAEELFYAHGVQAVGMDRIRERSQVPLKRLYRVFPAKEALVAAYLERRDDRWIGELTTRAAGGATPRERVLAVFDWLADWFGEPGFRGCAFLNAFGELGEAAEPVAAVVRAHKARLRALLAGLARDATASPAAAATLTDQLLLLVEGATTLAALTPSPTPAHQARTMAETLLDGAATS